MASIFGRAIVVTKTNKSGGALAKGDVVIVDGANDNAVTTTTSSGTTVTVGVVIEENGIANNASGRVQFGGHVGLVNVNASVTRGHYGYTHTVAKQATDAGASRVVGTFCLFTTGGTTPEADLFSQPDGSSASGNVATDAIWDAAGDLAVGTGANTAAKKALGTAAYGLVSTGSDVAWAEILPWHISFAPMIMTPDATAGTGTWLISGSSSQVTFPFYEPGSTANSGKAVGWVNASPAQNDAFSYGIVLAAGTWNCHIWTRQTAASGIVTLKQDGSSMGTADFYAAADAAAKVSITGWTVSSTGKHTFQFIMATKNASSSGYQGWFFGIEFQRTA